MDIRLHNCPHCNTKGVLPTSDFRCPNCKMPLSPEDAHGRDDNVSDNGLKDKGREISHDGAEVMPDKLVTIATFSALVEASMARDQLDAEGVRAVLA
ncbi:MAG: hypothetical protein ACYS74_20810, partial [Planctomycetota bacterium]